MSRVRLGRMLDVTESSTMADEGESSTVADKGESSNMQHEKRVVLFGKTGAGKSTIANALVTGGIEEILFKSSNGARGCTKDFQQESRRGWTVLDTIGLGEAAPNADKLSADKEPEKRLKAYLKKVKDEYSHIIYVIKGERFTETDEMVWFLFTKIFKGGEEAFVILFTGVKQEWLREEYDKLTEYMKKVKNILAVDIPPKGTVKGIERLQAKIRRTEIKKLEKELEDFFEKRNHKYERPVILDLDDPGLLEEAKSIIEQVVKKLKSLFKGQNLIVMIKVLASVVGLGLAVAGLPGI